MTVTSERDAGDGAAPERAKRNRSEGRGDWSTWPNYAAATQGLRGSWWYPVMWSSQLGKKPVAVELVGTKVVLIRDNGVAYALRDRCPHRGVPLSLGKQEFPGTISCPYHGWTYDVADGQLRAVITDGPDSPICGKVSVETFPTAERLGMVWVFIGDSEGRAPSIDVAIPKELREHKFSMGGRIDIRRGGWRYAAENGFDEGHAKYLHRTSLWRFFKVMPTWSKTRVIPTDEGWITRVQDEVHWDATFPGYGRWTNERWWRRGSKMLGSSPSKAPNADPTIASLDVAGNQHIRLPGLLRIVHTRFIHYEWYVPIDDDRYRYIQLFVQFKTGPGAALFRLKYLGAVRWLFHGQFTGQDRWMVDVMDCPPERLYRPDVSVTRWRTLCDHAPPQGQAILDEVETQ